MRVILRSYDAKWQIDTPDPTLIGPWLKSLFDDFATQQISQSNPYPPYKMEIEIS